MAPVKTCFFRGCQNNSLNCIRKIFIRVPKNKEVRKSWFQSARNTAEIPSTSDIFCCEDHFNVSVQLTNRSYCFLLQNLCLLPQLQTDCENWQYFKTMGTKLAIKKGIVPRLLEQSCNEESQLSRSAEKRKSEVTEVFPKRFKTDSSPAEKPPERGPRRKLFPTEEGPSTSSAVQKDLEPQQELSGLKSELSPSNEPIQSAVDSPSGKFQVSSSEQHKVKMLRAKSKSTQTSWKVRNVGTLTDCNRNNITDKGTNTIRIAGKNVAQLEKDSDSDVSSPKKIQPDNGSSYNLSSDSGGSSLFKVPLQGSSELVKIEKNPRLYTGLPDDAYFVIKILCEKGQLSKADVLLTLKKIRTNDSFKRLAIDFGYKSNYPTKIFNKTLPKMASHLQELVIWPSADKIRRCLPQQFWANYKNVQSIIDCFEVEIQKPSGALHQALTWSQYKSANTAKYLISSTPNGLVNFISKGFGGRTSDQEIVLKSGYLDVLPNNCHVLADRGFKQIVPLLEKKQCKLVRPPSVHTAEKQTASQVRQSKLIASVRIHIERVIRRLREFKMIAPHACIPKKLLAYLDYIVIVACAIVNLQGPLIQN